MTYIIDDSSTGALIYTGNRHPLMYLSKFRECNHVIHYCTVTQVFTVYKDRYVNCKLLANLVSSLLRISVGYTTYGIYIATDHDKLIMSLRY